MNPSKLVLKIFVTLHEILTNSGHILTLEQGVLDLGFPHVFEGAWYLDSIHIFASLAMFMGWYSIWWLKLHWMTLLLQFCFCHFFNRIPLLKTPHIPEVRDMSILKDAALFQFTGIRIIIFINTLDVKIYVENFKIWIWKSSIDLLWNTFLII